MSVLYSVYQPKCPSHNVLEGISDKWSILTMITLMNGPIRFGELKRQLLGISPKMLTQTLKKLEKYGFVSRVAEDELVLKVEYSLTTLGIELSHILQSLTQWTELKMPIISESMQAFAQ